MSPYQLASPLLILVNTVAFGIRTVVTISDVVTSCITGTASAARTVAGMALSVAKADRTTIAAKVKAVLALPVRVAIRSFPSLGSIP